jgi:SAM-dependent methyltransferase
VNYVKSRAGNDSKVLDWGAGAGEFMRAIQADVAEVVGTELDHERIEFVTGRLGLEMAHPSMIMGEYGAGYFDVITLFHVLEHFVTPAEQLEQILPLLNDDGLLIIEVPNLDDWMLRMSHEYQQFWYQTAHAQFFTPISLLALLDGVGLVGNVEFIQRYSIQNLFHWLWTGRPQIAEPNKIRHSRLSFSKIVYARMLQSLRATDTKIVSAVSGN